MDISAKVCEARMKLLIRDAMEDEIRRSGMSEIGPAECDFLTHVVDYTAGQLTIQILQILRTNELRKEIEKSSLSRDVKDDIPF